jgi:hypothetical protein
MTSPLFHAHSGLRYLVLLAALVAAGVLVQALVRGKAFDRLGRIVVAVFVGALDLQVLLGVLLLTQFPWYSALMGHVTMMPAAAIAAHAFSVANRRRGEGRQSNALALAGVLVPLVLIVGGILAIGRPIVGRS